jgi:hypothetical protein
VAANRNNRNEFRVERQLLLIAGVSLVAVALDSPIRGLERVDVPGEPFPPSQSFLGQCPVLNRRSSGMGCQARCGRLNSSPAASRKQMFSGNR